MEHVAVGIMVHNEAQNLPRLLASLCAFRSAAFHLDPIVVVSSGSRDGSDEIVRTWMTRDPRVRLVSEAQRRGKAHAINLFLASIPADIAICSLVSGDVLPTAQAWRHLLEPFTDPQVGMTGARPWPTNPPRGLLNRLVRFQWSVHHRVASRHPKLGELVAFRRVLASIPSETAVDEATLEALITRQGLRLCYVPQAVVHNHGPHSLREFLAQRQRIWAGHLWLRDHTGYQVSTFSLRDLAAPAWRQVQEHPADLPVATMAALLELWARARGTFSHSVMKHNYATWPVQPSTKRV